MKETVYIMFTAGRGPVECSIACANVFRKFCEWLDYNFTHPSKNVQMYGRMIIDAEENECAGYDSITVRLEDCDSLIIPIIKDEWEGTIKWIATKNSVRPNHKRKNWFVGCRVFKMSDYHFDFQGVGVDLKWETMRSSGAGGQHVNTTESGVRVTHIPTGISVKCQADRSQIRNKEMALELLTLKLVAYNKAKTDQEKREIWLNKIQIERGNEKKTFSGEI